MAHFFADSFKTYFSGSNKKDISSWLLTLNSPELDALEQLIRTWTYGQGLLDQDMAFDAGQLMFAYLRKFRSRDVLREGENIQIMETILSNIAQVQKRIPVNHDQQFE